MNATASPTTIRNADADINVKPTAVSLSPGGLQRRQFFDRTFSKLEKGSLRGSIFNLCAAAIGSGVLSLPWMFAVCGWAIGCFLIGLGAFGAMWSNLLIAKMAVEHRQKNYSDIAELVGGKCLKNTLSGMIIFYLFGTVISYIIIFSSLIGYVCVSFGMDADFADSILFRTCLNVPFAVFIFIPISLLRDMSSFQYAGVVTILALFYTLIVMIAEMPSYYKENVNSSEQLVAYLDLNIFTCASMTIFAYTCQLQLLPVYSELVRPNYLRIRKIVTRSVFIDFLFYGSMALAGYFSSFNYTNKIVLERDPLEGHTRDYWTLIAIVAIAIVVLVSIPINYHPWRNQFYIFFFKSEQFSNKSNLITTSTFMILSTFVSIIFPNITSVIAILGGSCSVTFCYTIPMYAWVKLSKERWYHYSNLTVIIFFSCMVMVGYVSVITTVIQIVTGQDLLGGRVLVPPAPTP